MRDTTEHKFLSDLVALMSIRELDELAVKKIFNDYLITITVEKLDE